MKLRIYTDTSVVGGCEDREYREPSRRLFDAFNRGEQTLVLSQVTLRELESAPPAVRAIIDRIPPSSVERIADSEEAENLAATYIAEGVIEPSKHEDAMHIAVASVVRVDVLVSWNYRYIVNLGRIRGYHTINQDRGYPLIEIQSPWDVRDKLKTVRERASKAYDCVREMRRIRDQISAETAGMSFEERSRYFSDYTYEDPVMQRLADLPVTNVAANLNSESSDLAR